MLFDNAVLKNIPPGSNDPMIHPVGVVLHVEGSGIAKSLYNTFLNRGGIESHVYILTNGSQEQYRDTEYEADAQGAGNSWYRSKILVGMVSFETQGKCGKNQIWSDAQLTTIVSDILQLKDKYKIPITKCTSPISGGIGYHAQFPEWNRSNHACPCPERIKQIDSEILPELERLTRNDPAPEAVTMIGYETPIGMFVPGGDRTPEGKEKLYLLAGGDSTANKGNFREYRDAGVTFVQIDEATLRARGFALQSRDLKTFA